MPQFDIYSWSSVCFWTLVFFHFTYIFLLRNVFIPLCEIDKFYDKLTILTTSITDQNFSNFIYTRYTPNIKLKIINE